MAQVGRISGGLLDSNLLREGATTGANQNLTFRNVSSASGGAAILHLDVINDKLGFNNDAPSTVLHVTGTTKISNSLTVDTNIDIANLNIQNNTIVPLGGTNNIILNSAGVITSTNVQTEELFIDNNFIQTSNTSANLELRPNGNGSVDVISNVNVRGNLHSEGNITAEGNIVFGDSNTDTVILKAEVSSDIVPDQHDTYSLGSTSKRWTEFEGILLNGQEMTADVAFIGGLEINSRQGKIWFVAKNGSNSNVGDHPQGPFETIDYAVTQATTGDTIYVYPGEYEESCPIEIPQGVTLRGHDQRNTIVYPASSQSTTDIFLLNGETGVSDLTIKDYFYDNANDIGYAFRFAAGGKVTSRSPYIQNVTVSTKGSTVSAADPLGFIAGDAGRGILADGAALAADTREASLLFHAITLIVPNADALVMTNGVRIEWLNSFTYFANRGFYATNGSGRVDDNLQTHYGAEVRSIGSANIYGNYGAEVDGSDTLIYLIMHNFGYIGTGADSSNDETLTIQANEVVEANSGRIQYQSQSHNGDFRIGDNFLIDFQKGSQSFNINDLPVVGVDTISVTTGSDITFLDLQYVQTGNVRLIDNSLASISGDMNIASASTLINLNGDVTIEQDLDVSGNLTIAGALIAFGNNQSIDTIRFESGINSNLYPKTTDTYDIGSNTLQWDDVWLTQVLNDDINITNNFIETTQTSSDLELRADLTGTPTSVVISDNAIFENNLTASGLTTFNGTLDVSTLILNNGLSGLGNLNENQKLTITGNLTAGAAAQFEEILIDGNVITTTSTNADLELRANSTGKILVPDNDFIVVNDIIVTENVQAGEIEATGYIQFDGEYTTGQLKIFDDTITTTSGNLELGATGDVVVDLNGVQIDNNLTVIGLTTVNNTVDITGTLTHIGANNQIGNKTITGNLYVSNKNTFDRRFEIEDIVIDGNVITTSATSSDLELRANGAGVVRFNNTLEALGTGVNVQDVTANTLLSQTTITTPTISNGTIVVSGNQISTSNTDLVFSVLDPNNAVTADSNTVRALSGIEETSGPTQFTTATDIVGTLIHTGPASQFGNSGRTGDHDIVGNLTISSTTTIDDIKFASGNIFTTDTDLILSAQGTGQVLIPTNDALIAGTFDNQGISIVNSAIVSNLTTAEQFISGRTTISDNTIFTDFVLDLAATSGKKVVFDSNAIFENDLTVIGLTTLNQVDITGTLNHNDDRIQTGLYSLIGDLTVSGNFDVPNIEFDNILIDGNRITTTSGDLELEAAGSGNVVFNKPVIIDADVTAKSTIQGSQATVDVFPGGTINVDALATPVSLTEATVLINNKITTSSGTNVSLSIEDFDTIIIDADATEISLNLDVDGTTTLLDTEVNGTLTYIGDLTQTGNVDITGNVSFNGTLTVNSQVQFENILIDDNIITTTETSSDLELRANGTAKVVVSSSNLSIDNDLTVDGLTTTDGITNGINISSNAFETNTGLEIRSNGIIHTTPDLDIEFDAGLNADVIFNSDTSANEDFTMFSGSSQLLNTRIGTVVTTNTILTHTGDREQTGLFSMPNLLGNEVMSVTGTIDVTGSGRLGNIRIEGNTIRQTAVANGDLELRANGTGNILVPENNVRITNNLTVSQLTSSTIQNISQVNVDTLETNSLRIYDNNIDAYGTDKDIILETNGSGNVVIDTNNAVFGQTLTATNYILGGVNIGSVATPAQLTQTGDRIDNGLIILLSCDFDITGSLTGSLGQARLDDITISTIGTAEGISSTSDLILRATNNVVFDGDLAFSHNNINAQNITSQTIINSGTITANAFETADITVTQDTIGISTVGSGLYFLPSTGNIVSVPSNDVFINEDLDIAGTTTTVQDLEVNDGTLDPKQITHVGDRTVEDTFDVSGDLTVTGDIIATEVQFEEINVNDNTITTTSTSAYLELQAAGTGEVQFSANAKIEQNLYLNGVSDIGQLTAQYIQSDKFETDNIEIYDNRIQSVNTDSNLQLSTNAPTTFANIEIDDLTFSGQSFPPIMDTITSEFKFSLGSGSLDISNFDNAEMPNGTTAQKTLSTSGEIRFNTDLGVFEGFTSAPIAFSGIYSADRQTNVTADSTSNELRLNAQGNRVATFRTGNVSLAGTILPNIDINDSTILGTVTDQDITFSNGTGVVNIEELTFENSKIFNNTNSALTFSNTGGFTVLSADGLQLPSGPSANRTSIEVGDTRWNTDTGILETYDGNSYIASAGLSNNITPAEFDDLLFEYTLIFG